MSEPTVKDRFCKIVKEHLGIDEDVTGDFCFETDGRADSLDLIELVIAAEEEFDINVNDDAAAQVKTVSQAVALIEKHLTEQDKA